LARSGGSRPLDWPDRIHGGLGAFTDRTSSRERKGDTGLPPTNARSELIGAQAGLQKRITAIDPAVHLSIRSLSSFLSAGALVDPRVVIGDVQRPDGYRIVFIEFFAKWIREGRFPREELRIRWWIAAPGAFTVLVLGVALLIA
jgi:hypothetical protein